MGFLAIRLPDVGEGVAEAELAEIEISVGDMVREDDVLAAVMTDKATVEIPSTSEGKVTWIAAGVGSILAVGAEFIRLEVDGDGNVDGPVPTEAELQVQPSGSTSDNDEAALVDDKTVADPPSTREPKRSVTPAPQGNEALKPVVPVLASKQTHIRTEGEAPLASPAVRARARDNGIDLRRVAGSGPAGRVTHEDLDNWFETGGAGAGPSGPVPNTSVDEVRVVGLRRKIAEQMVRSKTSIPHVTIVEEVDMTALEDLRAKMNASKNPEQVKLTLLPFLFTAMARVVADQPVINARYDDHNGILSKFGGVHIGMATQTPTGLMVPVLRHAEAMGLFDMSAEVIRLANAARDGTITREELTGSTITVTSLGSLGAIATTPIINHPEVSIVGVNKMAVRPVWDGSGFVPRKMMNLSCSFDHRIVDGWDAAVFVQKLKELIETPALIFTKG
ncbi:2-oxo acid dehydrogenase subunit E2 [Litoreibacter sp.]|nr:2-oxo acid dehydrogenase subunit E2 [Litoreibacter sp.]